MEFLAAAFLAIVVLPFGMGYWIGHGAFAAVPFAALGVTLLIRQAEITREESTPHELLLGIVLSTTISAMAAFAGGRLRERHRERL